MQRKLRKRLLSFLIASTAAAALFLGGCEGDKGEPGPPGRDARPAFTNISSLTTDQQASLEFDTTNSQVTGVTIASPPVVRFKLVDKNGNPVVGIGRKNSSGQLNNLAFTIAKLVPGTNGSPSKWVNYIVTTVVPPATTPVAASRPTRDREGTLTDFGDGTYEYRFFRDITQIQSQVNALTFTGNNRRADLGDLTYEPNLTHRLVIEYGGTVLNSSPGVNYKNAINIVYDFIPATGARVTATSGATQRDIVLTKYCNECHGNPGDPNNLNDQGYGLGITTPHSGRVDTRYCTICHTSQRAYGRAISVATNGAFTGNTYITAESTSANLATDDVQILPEFVTLIHKIHMGSRLTQTGYNYAGVQFNEIAYPQDPGLCRKCHRGETAAQLAVTPQGNAWNTNPSRKACGSCHDNVHFSTGVGHSSANLPQLNDAACTGCHTSAAIKTSHALALLSPNNPETPAGLTNFQYEIDSASVNSTTNDLTIKFRILGNGTPVTLVAPAATVTNPLAGFTGGPAFLLAYALPQFETGTAPPADFNNLTRPVAQPASIQLATLLSTTSSAIGTLSAPDSSGFYTATIKSGSAFPVGATMRTVALQSYFTQTGFDASISGRHTVGAFRTVTGDTPRRVVVDPNKCGRCHEYFEAHGGQRVFQTQVCVTCHNPNLSTSGRTITDARLAGFTPTDIAILTTWDPAFRVTTPGYALLFPETSNNFKDMIHGIHAGSNRTTPFRDVRGDRLAVIDAAEITFPNLLANCEACHASDLTNSNNVTYDVNLPNNVLPSTMVTLNATTPITTASKSAARLTVPNFQDLVVGPITAACVSCHDTPLAKAHMQANGAQLGAALNGPSYTDMGAPRSTLPASTEQCVLCHGQGRVADVVVVHQR